MKTIIPLATLVTAVASAAIAPALNADSLMDRHIHNPDAGEPTVDETSTRGQWVSSYSDKVKVGAESAVDTTSTRGQWVTSYSNKVGAESTVDTTSTRGQWVTSYSNDKGEVGSDPAVDETSTRGKWVTSYRNNNWGVAKITNHWLPTGPAYLDMDTLEAGYKAHLMIMHDSSSWLHSGLLVVKRFFNGGTE